MSKFSFLSLGRRAQAALLATVSATAALMLSAGYVNATSSSWDHDDEAGDRQAVYLLRQGDRRHRPRQPRAGQGHLRDLLHPQRGARGVQPQHPFNGPPTFTTVGTNAWADFAKATFDASGYVATQHLMSNQDVHINGNSATMSTYLHATHVLPDGTIDVANGTYEDEIIRVNGTWKIKTRTLKIIDFPHLGDP